MSKDSEPKPDRRSETKTKKGTENDEKKKKEAKLELEGGTYWLTRVVFLRFLSFIYLVAFLVGLNQNKELIGQDGLTPLQGYLGRRDPGPDVYSRLVQCPTVFWWIAPEYTDLGLDLVAAAGIFLSALGKYFLIDLTFFFLYDLLVIQCSISVYYASVF